MFIFNTSNLLFSQVAIDKNRQAPAVATLKICNSGLDRLVTMLFDSPPLVWISTLTLGITWVDELANVCVNCMDLHFNFSAEP